MEKIDVLDKGYVRLVNHMGSDLDVVNAARASFQKESEFVKKCTKHEVEFVSFCPKCGKDDYALFKNGHTEGLSKSDKGLINYLAKNNHMSPFRHAFATFEIKAPLMVARQWWKYVVGSDHTMDGWNEVSRRYVTMKPEFYVPSQFRGQPENKKQGSVPLVGHIGQGYWETELEEHISQSIKLYNKVIAEGMCAEQARLFLPAYAMYTIWRWSASLQSIAWFLHQRLADDAQVEIQEYAKAVETLIRPKFPYSIEALLNEQTTTGN